MNNSQLKLLERASQGDSKAIATFISEQIGADIEVQVGAKEDILLIRLIADESVEKDLILEKIENILEQIRCPIFNTCKIQAVKKTDMKSNWVYSLNLQKRPLEEDIFNSTSFDTINDEVDLKSLEEPHLAANTESSHPVGDNAQIGKWKLPGIGLGNFQKLSGQVSEQALRIAQETATTTQDAAFKATEQAMRSSINQTMNAFQIAVEEIHARKLPAKMTALTGTINVGVIQLSIRLDIPMDEETGEISMEVK